MSKDRYTIWGQHDKVEIRGVKPWMVVRSGLTAEEAAVDLTARQAVLRERDEPCRLVILPDGQEPR